MVNAEETKRQKARQLRYKKPIVKNLNLDSIKEELFDIQGQCEDVHWYFDTDDDTLINALDGNEDEVYEFKTMFADLCEECEQMQYDLEAEWVPELLISFLWRQGLGATMGDIWGMIHMSRIILVYHVPMHLRRMKQKILKQLTKDNLIAAARQCFKVYQAFIGLRHRYDCLKAAMDILRDQNTGYLQLVKKIEELYYKADEDTMGFRYPYGKVVAELDRFLNNLPQEAWIQ